MCFKPSEWRANRIQCIGDPCYRQEHDTDGKIARLFGDCWNAVFGRPFAKGSPYAIGPFSVLPFRLSLTLVYHGQTVGWIKMKRGTEVGLGQGHIVLDGDPSPPKGHSPPIFGPCPLWPNGWMHQDATWYGGRPRPRLPCVTWEPIYKSSLPRKRHSSPHQLFDSCLSLLCRGRGFCVVVDYI